MKRQVAMSHVAVVVAVVVVAIVMVRAKTLKPGNIQKLRLSSQMKCQRKSLSSRLQQPA